MVNRKGLDNLARWTLVFSAVASQLIAVLVAFGSFLNVHLYFILFAILPIAIFPIRQWRAIVFLFVLNAALYLTLEYIGYPPAAEVLDWNQTTVQVVRASYAASTVLTMFIFIFIWMVEMVAETNEANMAQATNRLTQRFTKQNTRVEIALWRTARPRHSPQIHPSRRPV